MIVVAIVAILAAIAVPSYLSYTREANRADAHKALLAMANNQEKRFPNANTYISDPAKLGRAANGDGDFPSDKGLYLLTATIADSGRRFTVTATAVTGRAQEGDTGCTTITLNSLNQRSPAECWQ